MMIGEFEKAASTLSLTRQLLSEAASSSRTALMVLSYEVNLLTYRGEWKEAARLARIWKVDADQRGEVDAVAAADLLLAWALLESYSLGKDANTGELEEAEAALTQAIEILDQSVYPSRQVRAWFCVARICLGRLKDARCILTEARTVARAQPDVHGERQLLWLEARLANAEGRCSEAVAAFDAAAAYLARFEMRWWWARILLDWAAAYVNRREQGDLERARSLLKDSQAAFEQMGIERYAALAQESLDRLNHRLR
jgi:hypothetical protein